MSAPLKPRQRLNEVRYEIRGELARRARELEAQGRELNRILDGYARAASRHAAVA